MSLHLFDDTGYCERCGVDTMDASDGCDAEPTVSDYTATLQAELAAVKAERDGLTSRLATVLLEREEWAREANAESARFQARIDAALAELPAIIDGAVIEGYPSIAINALAAKLREP